MKTYAFAQDPAQMLKGKPGLERIFSLLKFADDARGTLPNVWRDREKGGGKKAVLRMAA